MDSLSFLRGTSYPVGIFRTEVSRTPEVSVTFYVVTRTVWVPPLRVRTSEPKRHGCRYPVGNREGVSECREPCCLEHVLGTEYWSLTRFNSRDVPIY